MEDVKIKRVKRNGKYYIYAFDKKSGRFLSYERWSSNKQKREEAYEKLKEKIKKKFEGYEYYYRFAWLMRSSRLSGSITHGITVSGLSMYKDDINRVFEILLDYYETAGFEVFDEKTAYERRDKRDEIVEAYVYQDERITYFVKIDMKRRKIIDSKISEKILSEIKDLVELKLNDYD